MGFDILSLVSKDYVEAEIMKGRGFLSSMVLFQKHNNDEKKKRCRRFPSIRRNHTLLGAVEVTLGWLLNWRRDSKAKIEVTLGSPSSAA